MNNISLLPIASPPWKGLGKRLESSCRKALYDFSLIEDDSPVTIALSGGKDSLTLLYLLHAISGRGFPKFPICAVYVEGVVSCGPDIQKTFLQKICDQLEVPLTVKTSKQKEPPSSCYFCARERRKLIFEAAKEFQSKTIAFGHHKNDQIETLMMNLCYKGEFASLLPKIPMHLYDITIIRPLIYISEAAIIEFAKHYGFFRFTCQCPFSSTSKRKETKDLIRKIAQVFPHLETNLAQASLNYGSKKAAKKITKH